MSALTTVLNNIPLSIWLSAPLLAFGLFLSVRGGLRWQTLKNLRGPSSSSWLYGHQVEFYRQNDVGELDFNWANEYGGAWKIDGCFGVRLLCFSLWSCIMTSSIAEHLDAFGSQRHSPHYPHHGVRIPQDQREQDFHWLSFRPRRLLGWRSVLSNESCTLLSLIRYRWNTRSSPKVVESRFHCASPTPLLPCIQACCSSGTYSTWLISL
jgi:hypothetical protein